MEINWQYFFGYIYGERYYKAEINGLRVEKMLQGSKTRFSIGNMDRAKKKYKTEQELIDACLKQTK